MRYNRTYILVLLLIRFIGISAQSVISGRIIDKDSIPVASATILLLNQVDSSFVTGTVSNFDGRFEITSIKPDNYVLSFSMMGFKKIDTLQQVGQDTTNKMGDIVLEEDSYPLAAVFVTGRRPPVKIEPGKMTVNLSSALLSTDGNILDALRKLPGVIVQNDGTIILNGKSGANVLIDDKATYLSGENLINYLRSIPTNSVDNIELISQPSSKYDASGDSGFINIQKKRIKEQGVNLAASAAVERGKRTRANEGLSLSFRHHKLNMRIDYTNILGANLIDMSTSGHYLDPVTSEPLELRKDILTTIDRQSAAHNLKTGADYDLSEKVTLEAYFSSNWYQRDKNEVNISDFFFKENMHPDSTLTARSSVDHSYTNLTGGADIAYTFSERGKWDASFDYQLFDQDDDHLLASIFETRINPLKKDTLSGKTTGDIKIYSGQTNMNYDFSEKFGIEAGVKSVFVNIANKALYKNLIDGYWHEDDNLSSRFGYKENINAGYFQLNTKWSSWFSTTVGLRLENTNTKNSYQSNSRDTTFNKNHLHLFPTVTAQYRLSDNYGLSMAYGRRIARPNYRSMNPFVEVRDQFLYEQGNTELQPELIDNAELSLSFRKMFSFNMFHTRRKNPVSLSFLVKESRVLVMPLNLSDNHSFGLRVGMGILLFKWWSTHMNGSLTHKQFEWMRSGETFKIKATTPMLHVGNQFTLPYGWSAEAFGYYSGEMLEGQMRIEPLWTVSLGVRKNLFKDKFSLYIYAHDIFHSNRPRVSVDSNYLYYTSKEKNDSRMIGISLGYRFNRGREIKKSQRDNRIEESERIGL